MLRAGRFAERYDSLPLGSAQRAAGRQLLTEGPHIVTGGLGRIGLVLGSHLAGLGAHTVLTSRRGDSPGEPPGAVNIEVRQLDLTNVASIEALLSDLARRHGRLGGIFHAAGRAALADIRDTTSAFLEAELEPKVLGSINLKKAILRIWADRRIAPSFVMTFSSLAAVLGGLGMAAYASSNRVMDALAAGFTAPAGGDAARPAVPWISVRWDDWDFDYGEQQSGAYARTRANLAMTPGEGLAAIEAILGEPSLRNVLVSATLLEPRLQRWVNRTPRAETADAGMTVTASPSSDGNGSTNLSQHERRVREAYVKVLGANSAGLDDNFFDLGGDSLLAAEVIVELNQNIRGGALRITDVFDHPTIRKLAERLESSGQPELAGPGAHTLDPGSHGAARA
jgi:NAD(P)-dependent dehydrogenase (short-subunit alcohol dehydrogenase family)/acyl carrier protein